MEHENVFTLNKEAQIRQKIDSLEMELVSIEEQKIKIENEIEARKAELESETTPIKEDMAA
jgi:homoserine trans-succinylase